MGHYTTHPSKCINTGLFAQAQSTADINNCSRIYQPVPEIAGPVSDLK